MSTINLIPEDYIKQRVQHRIDLICVILFAIVMAIIMGADYYYQRQGSHTREVHQDVTSRFSDSAAFVNSFFALQNRKATLMKQAEAASRMDEKIPQSYILATVANARCHSVLLEQLKVTVRQPAHPISSNMGKPSAQRGQPNAAAEEDTPPPPPIVTVEVNGEATHDGDVAEYYGNLKANPLFEDVTLCYTREMTRKNMTGRRFQILMTVHQGLDVLDLVSPAESEDTLAKDTAAEDTQGGAL